MMVLIDTNVLVDFIAVRTQTRKDILSALCEILAVEALSKDVITNALSDTDFADFEDCLQDQCASAFRADYIITRNTDDFACSSVPAITPSAFCERFLNHQERSNPS